MSEKKTALTAEERITAAYLHFVRDLDQQDIAAAMGGVNIGRVNDACHAVWDAAAEGKPRRKRKSKKDDAEEETGTKVRVNGSGESQTIRLRGGDAG